MLNVADNGKRMVFFILFLFFSGSAGSGAKMGEILVKVCVCGSVRVGRINACGCCSAGKIVERDDR